MPDGEMEGDTAPKVQMWVGSMVSPKLRDYFLAVDKNEMTLDEHRIRISELTLSEDVASACLRWLKRMEFEKRVEIRSNRPGHRCFVDITFGNPIVRAEWKSLISDQIRVIKSKADPVTKSAMTLGDYRVAGTKEQQKTDRPWSL